jgi:biopolymer transport protein TolQ
VNLDVFDLVLQASLIVRLVLLVLVVFSVTSWALILYKWRELKRAQQDSEAFVEVYHEGSLETAYEAARRLDRAPLAAIFLDGWVELNRLAKYANGPGRALSEAQMTAVRRHVDWAASRQLLHLERGLSFLATTGSATPFIGLFGTVVGIIDAFTGIAATGSASLAVVAPGIAEALIATAVGLVAAIPATIFYNHFVGRLRHVSAAVDLFAPELCGDLERHARPAERAAPPKKTQAPKLAGG